jgi:hypothetical protein
MAKDDKKANAYRVTQTRWTSPERREVLRQGDIVHNPSEEELARSAEFDPPLLEPVDATAYEMNVEDDEPFEGYNKLDVNAVIQATRGMGYAALQRVIGYEEGTKGRSSLLPALEAEAERARASMEEDDNSSGGASTGTPADEAEESTDEPKGEPKGQNASGGAPAAATTGKSTTAKS